MRIGIDIDDVITDTSLSMKKYTNKYDINGDISNHLEEVMRGEMPTQNIEKFFEEYSSKIYKEVKVKSNASEVIQRLLDDGNEIYIVTSRGEIKFKGSEKITLEYFKLNNINYTKILFNSFEKAKVCKDNSIDLMIDDSVQYCSDINRENMRSILFNSEVNKSISTAIERVDSWLELEKKIKEIKV